MAEYDQKTQKVDIQYNVGGDIVIRPGEKRTGVEIFCDAKLFPFVKIECIVNSSEGKYKTILQPMGFRFIELKPYLNYKITVRIPQVPIDFGNLDSRVEINCILNEGEIRRYTYKPGWTAFITAEIIRTE
jgi:hypothetical protein